jgi:hypothetical protein
MILSLFVDGMCLKPEYKKPIALPLGEAAKGSGQCNAGSAVMPGAGATTCAGGVMAAGLCQAGDKGEAIACQTGDHGNYIIFGCIGGTTPSV